MRACVCARVDVRSTGRRRRAVGPDRPLTKMHLEGRVDLLELLALLELRATRRIAPILFFPGRR